MSTDDKKPAATGGPPTKQRKIDNFFMKPGFTSPIQSQATSCSTHDETVTQAPPLSGTIKVSDSSDVPVLASDQPPCKSATNAVMSSSAPLSSSDKGTRAGLTVASPVDTTAVGDAGQWYKGCKLDAAWLEKHYPELEAVKLGKRKGLKCKICYDNIAEAKKYARNGTVPVADGVRCDGTKELQRIIDHVKGNVHAGAQQADTARKQWTAQSDKHPWVKILKEHNVQLVSTLIRLAVDVHNDSVTKTLSAWSWPSRSLAQMHAENQVMQYADHGLDADFMPFNPPQSALHYRNPDRYREMLSFVSKHELNQVTAALRVADCIALQIDKSVDKYNVDNIFVTARYMDNESFEMKVGFLGECHSEIRGVAGMIDALHTRFKQLQIDDVIKSKMVGLTTDGESANTGRHGGLWVKMSEYLERGILTFWCVAHRSDLAFESIESSVPEFRHWLADVKSVATYFRASSKRQEDIDSIAASEGHSAKHFPRHHEVRFAEHLANVVAAVLSNSHAMCTHWNSVVKDGENSDKQKARGFLKEWSPTSFNMRMSALTLDILRQFTDLQKEAQRTFVTLPDLMQKRESVLQRLTMMLDKPYPGGREEQFLQSVTVAEPEQLGCEIQPTGRRTHNLYVTSRGRNFDAVRLEVVTCARNFLETRLNDDQDAQVKAMVDIANAANADALIKAGRSIVAEIFGRNHVSEFADDATGYFVSFGAPSFKPHESITAKLYSMLQRTTKSSVLNKLIQTFLVTCPHSMITERVISCHTELKSDLRASMLRETVNDRLCIALNSAGTANFDPRPAVAAFLATKARRSTLPDDELYRNREFVKKFFSPNNCM